MSEPVNMPKRFDPEYYFTVAETQSNPEILRSELKDATTEAAQEIAALRARVVDAEIDRLDRVVDAKEVKFRGKRIDNGAWVQGFYFITPLTDENSGTKSEAGWFFLWDMVKRHCISTRDGVVFTVDPATVEMMANAPAVDWKSVHAKLAKEYEDRMHVRPEFATLTADWIVEFVRQQIEGGAK